MHSRNRIPTSHVLAMLLVASIPAAHAQDRSTPLVGGPGGSPFVARCPPGQVLMGLEMRTGNDIDAVRPLCSKPVINVTRQELGPSDPGYINNPIPHYKYVDSPGYGEPFATTGWFGGSGGSARRILASNGNVVTGLYVESEGINTVSVNGIALVAYRTQANTPTLDTREVDWIRDGMRSEPGDAYRAPRDSDAEHGEGSVLCPVGNDGWNMLAVGIHGRSGEYVDAIGLICGYPGVAQRPVQLGRVATGYPAPPPDLRDGEPPICAYARSARARNSPAAPSLATQCEAARRALPTVLLGRVPSTGAAPPVQVQDGEPPICASARSARGRNSPAAPGLERQCAAARQRMVVAPPPAVPAAPAPPDPPVAPVPGEAPAAPVRAFMPPVFDDGAQLWACASAADGDAAAAACPGLDAAAAYCRLRGLSGALELRENGDPALTIAAARPGIGVRAANGDACLADACAVVSELLCAP